MKAKRLCAMAVVLCMILWMMPVGAFATEEMSEECICLTSCSEEDVNEDCDVCSRDYKKCEKTKQRTVASTEEAKTSTTTAEKKEEVTTKATTEKKEEVTTEATTEKKEQVTTKATTEKKEEVTTEATTEKKEEVIAEATTEKTSETTEQKPEDTDKTGIDVNETNFPDEAFRNWIINNISGAEDKVLTEEEIEAVKEINVSGHSIKSLSGIKQFKHLEILNCSNNNLKTLDLTGLEALKTVNAGGQDGGTATVVEEKNGWKLYMEKVVGEDNLKNVTFTDGSLPEGSKYQYGVVAFSEEPDSDVTYGYKTGTDTVMEVTLKLDKKALTEIYTITLDEKAFNFGKKCVDITPSKASIEIKNNSDESINFQVVSTSEASNYVISKKEGAIAAESTETIKIGPKEGLKAGDYKESFSIKVDGEEAKTFNASFQVVEHSKKEAWSYDNKNHWHVCRNCDTKVDVSAHKLIWKVDQQPTSTKAGYGHNECSVCGYEQAPVSIDLSVDINEKNFPDTVFRNWIIKNISGAEDYILTAEEIKAVQSINVSGQGIKSLVGIEKFKHLKTLNCSNNNLKTLDLTKLEALKTVNVDGQNGGTATVVQEKNGWKLYMKDVVGQDNVKNVEFAVNSLPKGAEYKNGVVIFASEPDIAYLKYYYKTGISKDMQVTLTLDKKPLSELGEDFKITLYKDKFDFGKKCVGVVPSEQSFKIENKSSKVVEFEIASTSQNSNYIITLEGLNNGKLEAGSTVTVKMQPKSGLRAGIYNENFNIKVNGKDVETFSTSFEVIEHNRNQTWSSDSDRHWHVCTNCGVKFDEASHSFVWKVDQQATATKNGYGHNECSVCGYKKASVIIAATGTTSTRINATTTTRTATGTTAKSLLSKIIPTTGDDSRIVLWLGVLVICGVTILGALGRYFSKRK